MTRLAAALPVLTLLASLAADTPSPASAPAPQAAAAIAQLKNPDPGLRAQAHQRLLLLGQRVHPALREAMNDPALPGEARQRIAAMLAFPDAPGAGVTWVGAGEGGQGDDQARLRLGDVVVAVDGRPVGSLPQWQGVLDTSPDPATLRAWRAGRGTFEVPGVLLGPASGRLASEYPSILLKYRRHGHKGPGADAADRAMEALLKRANPLPDMEAAWNAGCRDALLTYQYLRALVSAGRMEDARKIAALPADGLRGDYPGGEMAAGRFPKEVSRFLRTAGQPDRADALLEQAVAAAEKAGAWEALRILRGEQAHQLAGPPEKDLAFWNRHKNLLRADDEYHILVQYMAVQMSASGDPGKALEFLQAEPDLEVVRTHRAYYALQNRLRRQRQAAAPGPHKVLVRYLPAAGPMFRQTDSFSDCDVVYLPPAPWPGQVEWQMRITERDRPEPGRPTSARVGLLSGPPGRGDRNDHVGLGVSTTGILREQVPGQVGEEYYFPRMRPSGLAWTRLAVAMTPGRTQTLVEGVPFHTRYHARDLAGAGAVHVQPANGEMALRDVRYFVFSAAPVDNAAIEAAYVRLGKAFRAADLPAAQAATAAIGAQLAPFPQAKGVLAELALDLQRFQALLSPEGLSLCRQDLLDGLSDPVGRSGSVTLRDGWLVLEHGSASCPHVKFDLPLPLPDDLEIRGVLDASAARAHSHGLWFDWASNGYQVPTSLFVHPRAGYLRLGEPRGGRDVRNLDLKTPLPFALRTRGGKAVLFLRYGSKPDLQLDAAAPTGNLLRIYGSVESGSRLRFGQLTLRHLPASTPLDAPVRLPDPAGTTTRPGGKDPIW